MGNTVSCKKANYEDLQECILNKDRFIIINTVFQIVPNKNKYY